MAVLSGAASQARHRVSATFWVLLSYLLIGLVALTLRVRDLGGFVRLDEINFWMQRSLLFLDALRSGDYAATAISTHPGVTTISRRCAWIRRHKTEAPHSAYIRIMCLMRFYNEAKNYSKIKRGFFYLRRIMRRYSLLICTLVAATLFAGCGAGSGTSTPQPAPAAAAPQASAAPGAPPAAAATPQASAPPATAAPQNQETPVATAGNLATAKIALKQIADGLEQPVYATHAGDNSGRLFVVEKRGRIIILRDGAPAETPFLDISDRVGSSGSDQGLLSVAFHPQFAQNGRFFVDYTDRSGDTVISRFQANGDAADPDSETVLLKIDQPYANHNGGLVLFGPDNYLYIGMGDGGSGGDPQGNGQNRQALLGKMLRIDVDGGEPYGIPSDNPWPTGGDARPEVWAYGLRNPWRFSFDRANGDLYIADVGQGEYEEIDVQRAGSAAGQNYGWNIAEGSHCFRSQSCDTNGLLAPVAEYDHSQGCSITGGYVYRGAAFPSLQGLYFYGDYCSGKVWVLSETSPGRWEQRELLQSDASISSFGEDQAGELYLTDLSGKLYQVVEG
jgi:glucose/arabinose dehydrogenase